MLTLHLQNSQCRHVKQQVRLAFVQECRNLIGMGNDTFWAKYTNERFVELAFEGHRFWDVRRWKEADKYFKYKRNETYEEC